jgi:replication-associated recombination protein RarA
MIRRDRIAHAYLITGPAQCGKTTLAREFAKTLNCESQDCPCHICGSCTRIASGEDTDVLEIVVPENRRRIQIDQVREFRRRSALTTANSKYKIAIVSDAALMSDDAANAFLKTLEEPASKTVVLLATHQRSHLLATVASRCLEIGLGPLSRADIQKLIRQHETLARCNEELILDYADGMAGWALTMASDKEQLQDFLTLLEEWRIVLSGEPTARISMVDRLATSRTNAQDALNVLARHYAVTARREWGKSQLISKPCRPPIPQVKSWVQNLSAIRKAIKALDANTLIKPTLENLMISVTEP